MTQLLPPALVDEALERATSLVAHALRFEEEAAFTARPLLKERLAKSVDRLQAANLNLATAQSHRSKGSWTLTGACLKAAERDLRPNDTVTHDAIQRVVRACEILTTLPR